MSSDHIIEYIKNKYTMYDLIEKVEPFIDMEDLIDALQSTIDLNFHIIFEEELEEYYGL